MSISYPYKFSDWYGYDKDCATRVGINVYSTSVSKGVFACGQATDAVWYFPDVSPSTGDQVYTAATGTSTPSAGKYGFCSICSAGDDTTSRFEVNSSGVITSVNSC